MVAIDTFSLLGQLDSLKVISLSTGDSILLSKSYGLMRFPTFDSTLYVTWAGIQNRNLGERIFGFREIFDFEIGDVFYYDVYQGSGGGGISGSFYNNIYKKIKTTVTGKTINLNTVNYNFHIDLQTKIGYTGIPTVSNSNTSVTYNNGYNYHYNNYPIATNSYVLSIIEYDSTWNCWLKSFPYRNYRGFATNDTLWGGDCFESTTSSRIKYGKGLGIIVANDFGFGFGVDLTGAENDTTLVGYIKNGVSVGTIYPDWQFTDIENPNNEFITLSPNPAKDQLFISLSKGNSVNIRIWDMQGREKLAINSLNSSITFRINDLVKGLYFVEVRDAEGRVFTEKFVKE